MFLEERQLKILDLLKSKNRVEVQELSSIFNVSEDTVRRDLRLMEKKGVVHRTYGGAILPSKVSVPQGFVSRERLQPEAKEEIARLAASYIQEQDTVLLDGSTTVARLVPFLSSFNDITVVTNSIEIAHEVTGLSANIKLFIIGGLVRHDIANVISTESLLQLKSLYVDKVFIGACSISEEGGLSTPVIEEAPIKKAMLEAGREICIMADSSKFGHRSMAQFGTLKPEYMIITDSGLPADMESHLKELVKKGMRIVSCSRKP